MKFYINEVQVLDLEQINFLESLYNITKNDYKAIICDKDGSCKIKGWRSKRGYLKIKRTVGRRAVTNTVFVQ